MATYTITCSEAIRAQSVDEPKALPGMLKEPWLHYRAISIFKQGNKDKKDDHIKWYAVVYVWDTREVVQVIEQQGFTNQRWGQHEKAIDNNRPLKDSKHMLPGWMRSILTKKPLNKVTGKYELGAAEGLEMF
jgi:hypothetical protein